VRNIFAVAGLTVIWIILVESFAPIFLISGVIVSSVTLYFSKKYVPLKEMENVDFSKLIFFPFYLIGQIYLSAIYVMKVILIGERVDIIEIKTTLEDESLKSILADTITLIPGAVSLDVSDDNTITIAWLRKKNEPDPELIENKDEILKGKLEYKLLKAQK